MTYEDERLLMTPTDHEMGARMERFRQLGIGDRPDVVFDDFAHRLAQITGAPYAMVNFIGEEQYFAGLHAPEPQAAAMSQDGVVAGPGRVMAKDHGYCPHVVKRRKALPLEDVCAYPRFAGNPVMDELGIRAYLGAPLIDHTGTVLGTVCVVDTEPHDWGREGLQRIKAIAADVVAEINRRDGVR
ncbi:GAF domain-containing protein [Stackebrandtia albiflava]|uniref:GAF domain-containing protein n=1 Tax=Stackebrandtia albiflava TaxID=406432 RepID=A0A562VCI1_9ACTN|nr:GAF domain-containing protein [Stackebrandtia albiflava]TWJ15586.1 GAF domain-containing protein [Stackebrandtia albiflava]